MVPARPDQEEDRIRTGWRYTRLHTNNR